MLSKDLAFVGGIENAIYSYEKDNQTFFLRFGHSSHMTHASRVFPIFWEGYATESHLDSSWMEHLELFVQVRDAILFMYLPPSVPKDVRERFGRRILGEEPFTDFEFSLPGLPT